MVSFKKFIWSFMAIVLFLVGGSLFAIASYYEKNKFLVFSILDEISFKDRLIIYGSFLIFSMILIMDIIIHRREDRKYLV